MRRALAFAFLLLLAGCATDQPIAFSCERMADFRIALDVTPGGPIALVPDGTSGTAPPISPAISPLDMAFRGALVGHGPPGLTAAPTVATTPSILVLSGGGKWGAYGAGLLSAWSRQTAPANARPEFAIVTGVSTGALQSTFAFLGADVDAKLVAAYNIQQESQLVIRHGSAFFLSHGSTADLSPLRGYALAAVAPLLDRVAAEGARGRLLLVGTIDALDGKMYAIDLTKIARETSGATREQCYVGALLASAAIPVIFRQITIDGRPYFDGGVRQSVFLTSMQQSAAAGVAAVGGKGKLYVLFNGVPGVEPRSTVPAALLPTLGRLRELSFDQIEQNSVYAVSQTAGKMTTFVATAQGNGCVAEPGSADDIFNPAFMHCLIAAGEASFDHGSPWKYYGGPK